MLETDVLVPITKLMGNPSDLISNSQITGVKVLTRLPDHDCPRKRIQKKKFNHPSLLLRKNQKKNEPMLSSEVLLNPHSTFLFQLRSLGLLVCPPWTNSNSGGPSSASSGVCSSPIFEMSQMLTRLSDEEDANTVSLWGDHASWMTSSVWASNEWSFKERFRRSHRAIVCYPQRKEKKKKGLRKEGSRRKRSARTLSPDAVSNRFGDPGLNDTALISAWWASI